GHPGSRVPTGCWTRARGWKFPKGRRSLLRLLRNGNKVIPRFLFGPRTDQSTEISGQGFFRTFGTEVQESPARFENCPNYKIAFGLRKSGSELGDLLNFSHGDLYSAYVAGPAPIPSALRNIIPCNRGYLEVRRRPNRKDFSKAPK